MAPRPDPGGSRDPWPERARRLGDGLLLLAAGSVVALAVVWLTLPDPLPLARKWPATTAYIELRREQAAREKRALRLRWEPVELSRVPDHVRRAVRVAEDASFFRHGGVDWHEVWVSVREWWTEEERLRGASTITMQLARNLYLSPDRSYWRKLREVLLAVRLEKRLPKGRILELYLSTVELGPGVFGVQAASRHYWGAPVWALDGRQAAELAATLPSPLEDNPRTRTPRFEWRAGLIHERAFGAGPGRAGGVNTDTGVGPGAGRGLDSAPPLPSPAPVTPDTGDAGGGRPGAGSDRPLPGEDSAGSRGDLSPPSPPPAAPPPRAAGRRAPTSRSGTVP